MRRGHMRKDKQLHGVGADVVCLVAPGRPSLSENVSPRKDIHVFTLQVVIGAARRQLRAAGFIVSIRVQNPGGLPWPLVEVVHEEDLLRADPGIRRPEQLGR